MKVRGRSPIPLVVPTLLLLIGGVARTQPAQRASQTASSPTEPPQDSYGRTSPRGTVIGFLGQARKGNYEAAARYLNTRLQGSAAATQAYQLFVVLDRRLPARLAEISDRPEGSLFYPGEPDQDFIGTIESVNGGVDLTVERLNRGKLGSIWLFSRKTLQSIPALYKEVNSVQIERFLPLFFADTRIAGIPVFQFVALLVGLPLLYFLTGCINLIVRASARLIRRRFPENGYLSRTELLPKPVRLLMLAALIQWALRQVTLPLLARQFWSGVAALFTICGAGWLAMLLNAWAERHVQRQLHRRNLAGSVSILRFIRRAADVTAIVVGILITLRHFGVNVSTAVAGLGLGGIAVAFAAQKTLENVIGGLSLIFDQSVRVGDFVKVADTMGTVEGVGVRSTRIRTLSRTQISVPNGQIANVILENFSVRDKFWLNHVLGLHYGTTVPQIHSILEGLTRLLERRVEVEPDSIRIRLIRFGASSLDVELFAYCSARDWNHFLEIQADLLLRVLDVVQENGAKLAIPAQTLYLASSGLPATESSSTQRSIPAATA